MERITKLRQREILSADGNSMGSVSGFSYMGVGQWNVTGVTIKLDKETAEELGKKAPLIGALRMDIGVEDVKVVSDNMVLVHPLRAMASRLRNYNEAKDVTRFVDKQVVDTGGKDLGTVEDVMMDTERWKLPTIMIKLDKEVLEYLRMEKCPDCERHVTLPMAHVSHVGDVIMLNITKEKLGDLVSNAPVKTM